VHQTPISEQLATAMAALQRGNLDAASRVFNGILAAAPDHPDALHFLGIVCFQQKDPSAARALIERSINLLPNHAVYLANYSAVLLSIGDLIGALDAARQCLAREPNALDAHQTAATALERLNRVSEAVAHAEGVVALRPGDPAALLTLGRLYFRSGRFADAMNVYRCFTEASPFRYEAQRGLAAAAAELGRFDIASAACSAAIKLQPSAPLAIAQLACVRQLETRYDEALELFDRALKIAPNSGEIHASRSSTLISLDRLNDAEQACQRAIEIDSSLWLPYLNLGVIHQRLGDEPAALAMFEKAHAIHPTEPEIRFKLGYAQLARGQFSDGWRNAEARFEMAPLRDQMSRYAKPRWSGEELFGKTVLVYCEQGAGDAFQFVRYTAGLAARGARVVVGCNSAMAPVMQTAPGVSAVVTEVNASVRYDYHTSLLSLPLMAQTTLESIPATVPYLSADAVLTQEWGARIDARCGNRPRVGLVWKGNAAQINDRNRSMALRHFAPLAAACAARSIALISMQVGGASELAQERLPIVDMTEGIRSYADTAAILKQIDLLISVDTGVAHLAGALARPVWTLLQFAPDFRWLPKRDDTPWYPTMRLFRQSRRGDWSDVVAGVVAALQATSFDRA
jgi:tetratricopeptide (TPR) repeat protein